jgi:hypothetical protein
VTEAAVAVKVAVVAAAATVTEAGTGRAALSEESATAEPPVGAALDRVTVQVETLPDTTDTGAQSSEVTVGGVGVTVRAAVAVPFSDAVSVTAWLAVTVAAVAVKVAVAAAAATVTEAGTGRAALLEESATAEPPVGAALDTVTVQVEALPETTDAGAQSSEVTVGGMGVTVRAAVAVPFSDAVSVTA